MISTNACSMSHVTLLPLLRMFIALRGARELRERERNMIKGTFQKENDDKILYTFCFNVFLLSLLLLLCCGEILLCLVVLVASNV